MLFLPPLLPNTPVQCPLSISYLCLSPTQWARVTLHLWGDTWALNLQVGHVRSRPVWMGPLTRPQSSRTQPTSANGKLLISGLITPIF